MNTLAVTILLFLSSILGVNDYPSNTNGWEIISAWEKMPEDYYLFSARNYEVAKLCKENPSYYIEFPSIIHSSSQVKIDNNIIASTSQPDFKHVRGFYGSLIIPCFYFKEDKALTWEVVSYTKYFARFHDFPKVIEYYPKANFFNETLNIVGAGVLLTLCILYLVLFTGKIPREKLLSLIFSNLFTSIYFVLNSAELVGISISMLTAHKIADSGLWIGFLFFIHFLYLEGLILKWMNVSYKISVFIALIIIFLSKTGDSIQLGTTIPFLFTIAFPGYAIFTLLKKGKLKSRKDSIQLIALFISFIVYWNDIFVVTGLIDFFPLLPLGIPGSYIFILLSVNESIISTYAERDQLKILTNQLKEVNENLRKTQDELIKSEKMAAMGRAVARIAHELNTPIYLVRSSVQNIQSLMGKFLNGVSSQSAEELSSYIEQYKSDLNKMAQSLMMSSSRAAELVRNFKEISTDQINVKNKDFQLLDYIKKSLVTMGDVLKRRKIEVNLKGDEVIINSDPGLFYQIIQNLITNVQKYAYDAGGVIDIEIKKLENKISIVFIDYGKGIPKENLPRIFDAFFTTGGGSGGVGLGLNIVYRIVTMQLKGQITCDSIEGKGTIFTITIPN